MSVHVVFYMGGFPRYSVAAPWVFGAFSAALIGWGSNYQDEIRFFYSLVHVVGPSLRLFSRRDVNLGIHPFRAES